MNLFIFLRKDLNYDFKDFLNLGIIIQKQECKKSFNVKNKLFFMIFGDDYLYDLEKLFIENGIIFNWLENQKKIIGIQAYFKNDLFQSLNLDVPQKLEDYLKYRQDIKKLKNIYHKDDIKWRKNMI